MPDALEPAELTEPVDVVAWLRALPVGTVLLDAAGDAWQLLRPIGDDRFFACVGNEERYREDSDSLMADVAAWAPFRVLWTPGGGA